MIQSDTQVMLLLVLEKGVYYNPLGYERFFFFQMISKNFLLCVLTVNDSRIPMSGIYSNAIKWLIMPKVCVCVV